MLSLQMRTRLHKKTLLQQRLHQAKNKRKRTAHVNPVDDSDKQQQQYRTNQGILKIPIRLIGHRTDHFLHRTRREESIVKSKLKCNLRFMSGNID
jgi:hypothetical protein